VVLVEVVLVVPLLLQLPVEAEHQIKDLLVVLGIT
jgi:hypothetical protein